MSSLARVLLLFGVIGSIRLMTVTTPQKFVNVTKGGSALLPCMFATTQQSTSDLTIQWSFIAASSMTPKQVYYYDSGKEVISGGYVGRLKTPLFPNVTMNASITISNMQVTDAGAYNCEVHNFPDIEGKVEGNIIVTVFEKPSKPFCAVHGTVESGHLVTLTCHSELGSPKPTYTWSKVGQAQARRPVLGTTSQGGVMYIRNLSQFEFGEYHCEATNVVGSESCNLELSHEMGDGAIAGAVIGAVLGAVLIILVVWYITHSLKKHTYSRAKAAEAGEMQTMPQSKGSVLHEVPPTTASTHQAPSDQEEEEEAKA